MMTPEAISSAAAVLLSLVFNYVPGASEWYAGQTTKAKAGWLVLAMAVVSGAAMGLNCANLFPGLTALTCNQPGWEGLIKSFAYALVASQTTYLIAPQTAKVKAAKAARTG